MSLGWIGSCMDYNAGNAYAGTSGDYSGNDSRISEVAIPIISDPNSPGQATSGRGDVESFYQRDAFENIMDVIIDGGLGVLETGVAGRQAAADASAARDAVSHERAIEAWGNPTDDRRGGDGESGDGSTGGCSLM